MPRGTPPAIVAKVAEEVQRLAERSSEATKQIGAIVKAIQADTQDAVQGGADMDAKPFAEKVLGARRHESREREVVRRRILKGPAEPQAHLTELQRRLDALILDVIHQAMAGHKAGDSAAGFATLGRVGRLLGPCLAFA